MYTGNSDLKSPRAGSGNLSSALDDFTTSGGYDDFLSEGDLTIDQIHNLSTSPKVATNNASPTSSLPQLNTLDPESIKEPEPQFQAHSLTISTSSATSTSSAPPPPVAPLPKVSPRRPPSPGKKAPRSSPEPDTKRPRKSTLPRVALLAQQAAAAAKKSPTSRADAPSPRQTGRTTNSNGPAAARASRPSAAAPSSSTIAPRTSSKLSTDPISRTSSTSSSTHRSTAPGAAGAQSSRPAWGSSASRRSVNSRERSTSGNLQATPSAAVQSNRKSDSGAHPSTTTTATNTTTANTIRGNTTRGRGRSPRPPGSLRSRPSGTAPRSSSDLAVGDAGDNTMDTSVLEEDLSPKTRLNALLGEINEVSKELQIAENIGSNGELLEDKTVDENKKEEENGQGGVDANEKKEEQESDRDASENSDSDALDKDKKENGDDDNNDDEEKREDTAIKHEHEEEKNEEEESIGITQEVEAIKPSPFDQAASAQLQESVSRQVDVQPKCACCVVM